MGYELDRLMQQYGLSTPVLAPAPIAPVRPVSPSEAPTSMKPGETNNPLWEQILKRNLDAHVTRFGVDWNTNRTTDAERAAALAAMQAEYAQAAKAAQDAYPDQLAAYDTNRAAYDQYATEYQRRLRETPMYAQPQFTGPSTSAGFGYATAPGGIGKDKYYSNIREWIAAHPNASYADILEEANKWGADNRDLMAATGSYWALTIAT